MAVKVIVRTSFALEWPEIKLGADFLEALELVVHLLKPASLAAFLLAFWRFGADLGWTSEFLISDGLMCHWQLWVALGMSMIASEGYLSRRFVRAR
jgi:hypothetical protein